MVHLQQDRERKASAGRHPHLAALMRLERRITEDQAFDAFVRARGRR